MTKAELEEAIQKELWGNFAGAIVGGLASIPLSRHVPHQHRFVPLLVLGAVGSLVDFQLGQKRAEPYKQRLEELRALERTTGQ